MKGRPTHTRPRTPNWPCHHYQPNLKPTYESVGCGRYSDGSHREKQGADTNANSKNRESFETPGYHWTLALIM